MIERHRIGDVSAEVLRNRNHFGVRTIGGDPLPDTFTDKAQALVEGRPAQDGRFVAEHVQAKCASKYEAAPGGTGGATPSSTERSGM